MKQQDTDALQQFEQIVLNRHSVRGFLPDRVPQDVLNRLFDIARWAPSGTNVQPWQVYVASGETCEYLRQGFIERFDRGDKIVTDHAPDGRTDPPWQDRKRACARALYDSMGIEWEDRPARAAAHRRNFEFFGAPHAAFFGMHEIFGTQTASDVGMYAQTLLLAMQAQGIATCAQGTLRNYPDFVREVFGIEPEIKILYGISFGYEDPEAGVNRARTERAPLKDNVCFLG